MRRVDPTITSGVTITSVSVCSPIAWNHLQTVVFLSLRLCSCHLPTEWRLSLSLSIACPSALWCCRTWLMLHDVLFKHPVKRLFVLHQSIQLTRRYGRFPPVLMAAVATDLTPVSPQEWMDLGTPATLSASVHQENDGWIFYPFKRFISFCKAIFRGGGITNQIFSPRISVQSHGDFLFFADYGIENVYTTKIK